MSRMMTEPNLSTTPPFKPQPRLSPWQELAYLSMAVMELSWIIPCYILLGSPSGLPVLFRSILVFGGILAAANLILRILDIFEIKKNLRRWVFGVILVLGIFFSLKLLVYYDESLSLGFILRSTLDEWNGTGPSLPPEFAVILLVIITAYRGAVLAGEEALPSVVSRGMRLGLILLSLVGLLAAITFRPIPGANAYLLVFLFASLLGMTASRINVLAQLRGGQGLPFDRQRVLGIIGATLGLVILAGLAGLLLSSTWGSSLILVLIGLGGLLLRWLAIAMTILLYPLFVVFFSMVQWVVDHLALRLVYPNQNLPVDDLIKKLDELASKQPALIVDTHLLKPIILGGLILLTGVAAVLLIRSRSNKAVPAGPAESESLLSQADQFKQLLHTARKNAQSIIDRFAQRLGLQKDARQIAAQRIRAIYIDLLNLAARLKYPRMPQQTPLEYLPELEKAFPGSQAALALITQAYQRIRYGELPETQDEVDAIENAWKMVQLEGRIFLMNHK
jgi:hypothetical protein